MREVYPSIVALASSAAWTDTATNPAPQKKMPIEAESMPEPHAAIALRRTVMVICTGAPGRRLGQVCDGLR